MQPDPKIAALEALQQKFSNPQEAVLAIKALRKQREAERFVCYWTATPKQADLFKQFEPHIKVFGVLGGNRSGKTEIGAEIAVAWALGKEFFRDEPAWEYIQYLPIPDHPCNIWVVGLDFSTLRDVIWGEKFRRGRNHPPLVPDIAPFLKKAPNDSDFQIFFANGSVITGKSADSGREKFQGASVDLVWIDEECEADVYDECYQRTVDCAGKILITLTPLTDIASGVRTPWVHDLYTESKKTTNSDIRFVQLSVMDNPYVPEDEKLKLQVKWAGHPEERARLYGDFVQRSGLVYPMWTPAKHCVKPFRIPEDWTKIVSIDPANTGTTAALWIAVEPRTNNYYIYREYYEREATVSIHAKSMLVRNAGDLIDLWLIDPKWGTQRNAETHKTGMQLYKDAGIPCRLARVDETYGYNVSLEYMNSTLVPTNRHPKVFVFSNLGNFIDEVTHYTWATFGKGELKGQSKEKAVKKNDHLMNAMQYVMCGRFKGRGSRIAPTAEETANFSKWNSYS